MAYYFLSQIFVISSFIAIFKFAEEFFNDINFAFLSSILLESIFFYNYTTPEFNVNIAQLPFWALSVFFTWRCVKHDKILDHILLGLFIGLGFLSKYLFLYLIIGIKFLLIFLFLKKKIKSYYFLIIGPVSLVVIFPHLIWLIENDFITITYGIQRTGVNDELTDHIVYPIIFIMKQIGILLPFFFMIIILIKKLKLKKIIYNQNYFSYIHFHYANIFNDNNIFINWWKN